MNKSRLLTALLIASSLTLQSCTLFKICSVITYPIFFLLTTAPKDAPEEPHLCKDSDQPKDPAERYLSLIYRSP